jgi:MoaA/NifB/PqqE/SkfB family radical SAM enzyme
LSLPNTVFPDSLNSTPLERLPLVTLYLTERCNSRCVTCDYWRHGRADMTLESVTRLLPSFARLGTRTALISGGEPLLNPEWQDIARLLAANGLKLWLLTSGLSLAKHARRATELFDTITVSMDGTQRATYTAIRGLDAFDKVCEGIRAAVEAGSPVGLRVTLQRSNYRELPQFVALARNLGAQSVSFLAVDVANPHAFGRTDEFAADVALREEDLPVFERLLTSLEEECAREFRSGFIAESPAKLHRIHQYFAALLGKASFPPVRCNAPEFSAVVGTRGDVQPCFFISGPPDSSMQTDLGDALNSEAMLSLREQIRGGARPECSRCVCSLWREPGHFATGDFLPRKSLQEHRSA